MVPSTTPQLIVPRRPQGTNFFHSLFAFILIQSRSIVQFQCQVFASRSGNFMLDHAVVPNLYIELKHDSHRIKTGKNQVWFFASALLGPGKIAFLGFPCLGAIDSVYFPTKFIRGDQIKFQLNHVPCPITRERYPIPWQLFLLFYQPVTLYTPLNNLLFIIETWFM